MSLKKSFLSLSVGNFLAALLGALATLLAIRSLQPHEWASVAIIIGLGPAMGVLLSAGSVNFQIRSIARIENPISQHSMASIFFMRRLVFGLMIIILAISVSIFFSPTVGVIFLIGAIRFIRGGASVLLSSRRQFSKLSKFLVIEKIVYVLLAFAFMVTQNFSVYALPISYIVSIVFFTIISTLSERLAIRLRDFSQAISSINQIWKGSSKFGIASLTSPLQQLDVVIVGLLAGNVQAGYFAAGSRLTAGLNVAGSAMSSVALPYFSAGQHLRFKPLHWRFILIICVAIFLFVGILFTAHLWVPTVMGLEYAAAVPVVVIYLIAVLLSTVIAPMVALLQAWGHETIAMNISVLQTLLGILGIAFGATIYGAVGASMAFLLSSLCVCIILAIIIYRKNTQKRVLNSN